MEYLNIKRRNGGELKENIPGKGLLEFLYGNNPLGQWTLWMVVKRKFFSILFGKYMDSTLSKSKIAPFIEQYEMDMTPYVEPAGGYQHFNDFFYRKIKPEFRPIGEGFVSPADGRVVAFNTIEDGKQFYIKGKEFDLSRFLQNPSLAQKYEGGAMCVIRLAPVDYHRYHFPTSGMAQKPVRINGYYYSVSPIALKRNWEIFWENEREYTVLQSKEFGDVLICDVGATLTGGIVQTYLPETFQEKGDEKGHFTFGGSTLVVLLEKGSIKFNADIVSNSFAGKETYILMGESIGE